VPAAGEIAGAALDVYEQEPLPREHPLWGMPNVLLTPHMAGHGPYLDERRFEIMADNCRAFAAGQMRTGVFVPSVFRGASSGGRLQGRA
jgi:phosphoglycerate dehydrogenase-like enzyme